MQPYMPNYIIKILPLKNKYFTNIERELNIYRKHTCSPNMSHTDHICVHAAGSLPFNTHLGGYRAPQKKKKQILGPDSSHQSGLKMHYQGLHYQYWSTFNRYSWGINVLKLKYLKKKYKFIISRMSKAKKVIYN